MADGLQERLRSCVSLLRDARKIVVIGHVHADGDVVGSQWALYHRLRRHNKEVIPFLFESIDPRYRFLGADEHVVFFDPRNNEHNRVVEEADAVVMLDVATADRLPGLEKPLSKRRGKLVRIDHHPSSVPQPVDLDAVDVTASSTGELIYDLLRYDGLSLTPEEAMGLFVAISTDTGWFRYSNTNARILDIAAKLVETGIHTAEVYRHIYQSNDLQLIRLFGHVVSGIREELDGRLIWSIIDTRMVRELGLGEFDTDLLLDLLRSSRDALCVVLFRETVNDGVRVNIRSKGTLAINNVAEEFGGGGHRNAAGITLSGKLLDDSAEQVVNALKKVIQKNSDS